MQTTASFWQSYSKTDASEEREGRKLLPSHKKNIATTIISYE